MVVRTKKINGIEIEGLEECLQQLHKIGDVMGADTIISALLNGAVILRDRAKSIVRLGPGKVRGSKFGISFSREREHLRDTIFAVRGKVSNIFEPSVIVGVDRKRSPHAHLVEFGHGGPHPAPAHPYLRPAVDQSKMQIVSVVTLELQDALNSAGFGDSAIGVGPDITGWIG